MEGPSTAAVRAPLALLSTGALSGWAFLAVALLLRTGMPEAPPEVLWGVAALGPGLGAWLDAAAPQRRLAGRFGLVLGLLLLALGLSLERGAARTWVTALALLAASAPLGRLVLRFGRRSGARGWRFAALGMGLGTCMGVLLAGQLPDTHSASSASATKPPESWDALGHATLLPAAPPLAIAMRRDGGAPTPLLNPAPPGRGNTGLLVHSCESTLQAFPHFRARLRVAVLGGEGGHDVQCARHHGATAVDWVVERPALAELVRDADWDLGVGDDVRIVRRAPRAYMAAARERYDLIVLPAARVLHTRPSPLLPTAAPRVTREALRDTLEALTPNGMLASGTIGEPDTIAVLLTALEAIGGEEPWNQVAVAQGGGVYSTLLRPRPFPMDEIVAIGELDKRQRIPLPPELIQAAAWSLAPAPRVRFTPVVPRPGRIGSFMARVKRGELEDFRARYSFDVRVATDDRPRVFDHEGAAPTIRLAMYACGLGLLAMLLIWLGGRGERKGANGRSRAAVAAFGAALPLTFAFCAHTFALHVGQAGQAYALACLLVAALAAGAGNWRGFADDVPALLLGAGATVMWPAIAVDLAGYRVVALAAGLLVLLAVAFGVLGRAAHQPAG